jgi:large conductance mechanosensitive channel
MRDSLFDLSFKRVRILSMKILQEFRDFAVKGNVIDLAIGVIIGGAFGKIITSLVNDVIMPPLSILTGGIDFSEKVIVLKEATETAGQITLNYGAFLNNIIDFLIVAWAIFFTIKQINKLKRKEEEKIEKKEEEKISEEVLLLREIRDSIRK